MKEEKTGGVRPAGSRANGAYPNRSRANERPLPRKNEAIDEIPEGLVCGRSAVLELLKSGRTVDKLLLQKGEREGSITMLAAMAIEKGIPVLDTEKEKLDRLCRGLRHQGVVAMAAEKEYVSLDALFSIAAERGEAPFFVLCDGVEDPHNLGAIIRCAEGAGAHGVIIPKRHGVTLTAAVSKTSAGALEHMAVCKVTNLAATVDTLKKRGVWLYAAEAGGGSLYEMDFRSPTAIVLGSEGFGVSRLLKEKCDFITSIGMYGKVNSFNVSCAAAVILCEAARQRHSV